MRGAQCPGDARGGRARVRSRQVYTLRRLLAAMILLLALVLLVPRARQAILGSEGAGPRADRGRETPGEAGPAAGVAGDEEDGAEKADIGDTSTGDKATGTTRDAGKDAGKDAGNEEARGDRVGK